MIMDEETIRRIVADVVSGQSVKAEMATVASGTGSIPVEVSARHVHLTAQAVEQLFGKGARLTCKRELSQPGEFLSEQRVKVVTPHGTIENVAVLGPERGSVQVELSFTDARQLGISVPVNLSGDLTGAGTVFLVGSAGMMEACGSAIAAKCHIHMTPQNAADFGVHDGQQVAVAVEGSRPMTFRAVTVRVSPGFALAMHIDFDEANACAISCGAMGRLVNEGCVAAMPSAAPSVQPVPAAQPQRSRVITEAVALELAAAGSKTVFLPINAIITPSAQDVFTHKGIQLGRR